MQDCATDGSTLVNILTVYCPIMITIFMVHQYNYIHEIAKSHNIRFPILWRPRT